MSRCILCNIPLERIITMKLAKLSLRLPPSLWIIGFLLLSKVMLIGRYCKKCETQYLFKLIYRPQLTFSTRVCFLMASLFLRFSFGFPSVHCSKSVSALFRKFKGSLSIIHPLPSEVRLFITQRNQDNFQPTSSSSPLIEWDIWRKDGKAFPLKNGEHWYQVCSW